MLVQNFEVLTTGDSKFSWEPASDGRVAAGAVSTGRDGNDELYIGRGAFQGSMTVGKVRSEKATVNYEIMMNVCFQDSSITPLLVHPLQWQRGAVD